MSNFIYILITLIFMALSIVYVKNVLHVFQQNRYELYRYTEWLLDKNNYHYSKSVTYIILMFISFFMPVSLKMGIVLTITIIFTILCLLEEKDIEYVKPLVYTDRVKRQIIVYTIFSFIITFLLVKLCWLSFHGVGLVGIISILLPYVLIYLVALATRPIEDAVKKKYENEARDILYSYNDLIKIGITGSFGKTTTKNVVNDIISEKYYTLITPASYNTPMGITRTIRELFKPIYQVFVCEMGADHVGEISYLMDFVKPKYGIVTSIGPQHLNTFGSLDNIIKEKMQEIEMLPKDGVGIINIDNEYIRNYKINNTCKIVTICIDSSDADYKAYYIKYSNKGTSFRVKLDGKVVTFKTILLGSHNVANILCGIALAKELGLSNEEIVRGVSNIKQVEHRLQIKNINGYTFIDNAFNSNPVGCKRSLDVLSLMNGKRVIVTPGLVDLGKEEDNANYEFGKYMNTRADFAILVGEKNTKSIYNGLKDGDFDMNNVKVVNSEKEAFSFVYANFTVKDTILLENDLPDAFLH